MEKHGNKSEAASLRQKAKELLKRKSEAEILELVQELAFLTEEREKYRNIFENMLDAYYEESLDGTPPRNKSINKNHLERAIHPR